MKKEKNRKRAVIIILAVLTFILIFVLGIYMFIKAYVDKMNYMDKDDWNIVAEDDISHESPTELTNLNEQGADSFGNGEGIDKNYVKNIVLIGTDNRHFENITTKPGNSDSIIVVSINSKTKKIYLTSIMRDTAAYIQYTDEIKAKYNNCKDGYDKINASNARGGPEFLLDIIEGNFKLKVDDYILVDFYSLIDIIDILGGIPMTVTDEEAAAANNYIRDMDFDRGVDNWETANILNGGGNLILNGVQAVGYARERQTVGADYNRTARQRAVIEQIIIKAKNMSLLKLDELADAVLPKVYTNMKSSEIMAMIPDALVYLNYDVEQLRIPFDNMYESIEGYLLPDYDATIEKLHSIIFATE